jgi:carboxyl-terminal processing protease
VLPETDIAYIRLYSFTQDLARDFNDISQEILRSSAKKIILDLRDNPGGYLEVAVDLSGWFLENGDVAVIESRGTGDDKDYRTAGPSIFKDWPVAVIINKGSASASEILAGALGDNRDAFIVGETSFGKGSVQEMISVGDDAYVKLTVADWLTPNGVSISKEGIEPGILVEIDENEEEVTEDLFLNKAIDVLNN